MELVKAQNTGLMQRMEISTQLKTEVLVNETVQAGLTEVEFRAAKASLLVYKEGALVLASKTIKAMTPQELTAEVAKTLKYIVRDIGIKNWGGNDAAYDSTRFVNTLKSYYGDLTYSEVELAFELLSAHKLDDFLPKNGQGHAERSHYQAFSNEYVGKVLNAFRGYKNSIWKKAYDLKPNEEKEVTQAEKDHWQGVFVEGVCAAFDEYVSTETMPYFPVSFKVVELLQSAGYIKEIKVTKLDRRVALVALLNNNNKTQYDKAKYREAFKEGDANNDLDSQANIKAMNRAIKRAFDQMVKKRVNPRDILK